MQHRNETPVSLRGQSEAQHRSQRPKDIAHGSPQPLHRRLGEALRNFTHPAHHVQDDGLPEDFSRADTTLAASATAGLKSALAVGQ
jgi:hypothetical protein